MAFSLSLCVLGFVSELLDTDELEGNIKEHVETITRGTHDTVYVTSSDSINLVIANYADSVHKMNAAIKLVEFEVLNGRHIQLFYSGVANKRLAIQMIEKLEELGMKAECKSYKGGVSENSISYCTRMGLKRSTAKLINKALKTSKLHFSRAIIRESRESNCDNSYFKLYLMK